MITIDYQSKLPLYEQIAGRFQALILRGVLPADRQMPSVRSLAVELSLNPNTIQKAYSLLEQQGYIYSVKGKGNYVSNVTALAEQKRKHIMKEAERLLSIGKDMGIARSEYTAVLDRLYGKEDPDDRTEKS